MAVSAADLNQIRVSTLGTSVDQATTWTTAPPAAANTLGGTERVINRVINNLNTGLSNALSGTNGFAGRFDAVIGNEAVGDQSAFDSLGGNLIQTVAALVAGGGVAPGVLSLEFSFDHAFDTGDFVEITVASDCTIPADLDGAQYSGAPHPDEIRFELTVEPAGDLVGTIVVDGSSVTWSGLGGEVAAGTVLRMTVTDVIGGPVAPSVVITIAAERAVGGRGPKGDKGDPGVTPDITITVTTGAAGSNASVTKTGTLEAPEFEFEIPRGNDGTGVNIQPGVFADKQDLEDNAPPAVDGDAYLIGGDMYVYNSARPVGDRWVNVGQIQGPQGVKGDQGDPGDTPVITIGTVTAGASAAVTDSGTAPDVELNFTLPQGDKGDKGDKGDQGDPGTDGTDGTNGTNGANGMTPLFTIGTVTAGTVPAVTVSGTAPNFVLSFVLPEAPGTTAPSAPMITSALTRSGVAGAAFPNYTITAAGHPDPTFTVDTSGAPGLTFTPPRTISGTFPTPDGSYSVEITATNSEGSDVKDLVVTSTVALQVPVVNSDLTPIHGVEDDPWTPYTITATNSPTSFSAAGLPNGLSKTGSTNPTITGTLTPRGTYNVTLSAVNAAGPSAGVILPIQIDPPPPTGASESPQVYIAQMANPPTPPHEGGRVWLRSNAAAIQYWSGKYQFWAPFGAGDPTGII